MGIHASARLKTGGVTASDILWKYLGTSGRSDLRGQSWEHLGRDDPFAERENQRPRWHVLTARRAQPPCRFPLPNGLFRLRVGHRELSPACSRRRSHQCARLPRCQIRFHSTRRSGTRPRKADFPHLGRRLFQSHSRFRPWCLDRGLEASWKRMPTCTIAPLCRRGSRLPSRR